jgi:hypothetical protein
MFSAEIVPAKQSFIQRNFKVPFLFQDVTEMAKPLKGPANNVREYVEDVKITA